MRLTFACLASLAAFSPMALAQSGPTATTSNAEAEAVDPRALAAKLGERLTSDFLYPEQGRRYAAMLSANAAAGKYDGLVGVDLAQKLTADLQAVAPDGHLRVQYKGEGGATVVIKRPAGEAGAPPPGAKPVIIRMTPPPPIESARWIAPGIAFVRFNLFPGGPEATDAARKFMAAHSGAKAIIFDVRTHMGGGLDEMDAIFPWLFAKPTRLASMAARKSVDEAGTNPLAGQASLRVVKGDPEFVTREHWAIPGKSKRLFKAKVYVLTSGFSGSAAEHFALAFKHSGRGTLIGRATYGANHFGGDQTLLGDFTAFIPVGRSYDPVTGKDWEGTGVTPDIDVPAEDALVKALTLLGVPLTKATQLSAEVAPKGPMIGPRG
jgi:hypothetical protein